MSVKSPQLFGPLNKNYLKPKIQPIAMHCRLNQLHHRDGIKTILSYNTGKIVSTSNGCGEKQHEGVLKTVKIHS